MKQLPVRLSARRLGLILLQGFCCATAHRARPNRGQPAFHYEPQLQEAEGRSRLDSWCESALTAQTGRCTALQRLLKQTELSKPSVLDQLEGEATALADSVERTRIAEQIALSNRKQLMAAAELDAADAAKDVAVFQRVVESLNKANKYQDVLGSLVKGAKAEAKRRKEQVALFQGKKAAPGEVAKLEEQYDSKRKEIAAALQQRYTADRSMEVLTTALEDESVYLADLQTTCELGRKVYRRLEDGPLTSLNRSIAHLTGQAMEPEPTAAAPEAAEEPQPTAAPRTPQLANALRALPAAASKPQKKPAAVAAAAPAVAAVAAAPAVTAAPAAPAASAAPAKHVTSAPSAEDEEDAAMKVLAAGGDDSAVATTMAPPTTQAPPAAPVAFHKKAKKTHKAKEHKAKEEEKQPGQEARLPMPPAATKPVSRAQTGAKHKRSHHAKKAHVTVAPTTAAPTTLAPTPVDADTDDAEPATPVVATTPKPVHAKAKAKKAAAVPTQAPKVQKQAAEAAAPAADDDTADVPPPAAPVAMSAQATATQATQAAAQAAETAQAAASQAAEAAAAAAQTAQTAAKPGKTPALRPAKKSEDFMGGVYDSASGNMPAEYSAWTPDGASPSHFSSVKTSISSPTDRMMAILGDGEGDAAKASNTKASGKRSEHLRKAATTPPPAAPKVEAAPAKAEAEPAPAKSDDKDLMAADAQPEPESAPVVKAHPTEPPASDLDADLDSPALHQSKASVEDTSEKAPAVHKKKAKKVEEAPADDLKADDALDQADAALAKPEVKARLPPPPKPDDPDPLMDDAEPEPPVKHHSHKEAVPQVVEKKADADADSSDGLDLKDDEAVDQAFPEKEPAAAKPTKGQGSLMQKVLGKKRKKDVGGPNLPSQYDAWSPEDEQAPQKKDASLEQMVAEFKEDDDAANNEEGAAPAKRAGHRKNTQRAPAPTKAPQAEDEDKVVYDDDDLPKHSSRPISLDLQGGWKSFIMKKTAASKAHKPKLDPDVAIMNSLYSNDGGLPQQYSAWKPSADDGASPDVKAAAKDLDNSVSFTQLSSVTLGLGPVARLIRHAAGNEQFGNQPWAFMQESATAMNRTSVANVLLEQFGQVLRSQTLRQLARAQLTQPKLADLWQSLRRVDPLSHPGAAAPPADHQAQAERWCQYFLNNGQSAVPVHKALVKVEEARNSVEESKSERMAMAEEVDARQQLVRTIEQDVSSLSTLLNATREEQSTSSLRASLKDLPNSAQERSSYQSALDMYEATHAEIADLLEATLKRRSAALEAQHSKLVQLSKDMQDADKTIVEKQAALSRSSDNIKATQKKLEGIQASCDATLSGMRRRQHSSHMEAHAIEMALKVLKI